MGNEAAYSCAALLFLVLVVLFAVSFRTGSQTRKYCKWKWVTINKKRYKEYGPYENPRF